MGKRTNLAREMADSAFETSEGLTPAQLDPGIRELKIIRKLLSAALLKSELLTQQEVAGILDVDRSVVSRMFPKLGALRVRKKNN